MQASTAPAWDHAWDHVVEACHAIGRPDACVPLTRRSPRALRIADLRVGALYPGAATVQPALLARGLREKVLDAGVELFEQTAVRDVAPRRECGRRGRRRHRHRRRRGDGDRRCAGRSPAPSPPAHRDIEHMVITEPVPGCWRRSAGPAASALPTRARWFTYFRTTPDGRIAFGWGGGRVVRGARTGGRAGVDPSVVAQIERHLLPLPRFEGRGSRRPGAARSTSRPATCPWSARSKDGLHCAFGYTGHGVGPSYMVGRSLASLALRVATTSRPGSPTSPEPLQFRPSRSPSSAARSSAARSCARRRRSSARASRGAHPARRRDPGADRDPHRALTERSASRLLARTRLDDPKPQVGELLRLIYRDALQLDPAAPLIGEQPDASAEQHGSHVKHYLVEQPGVADTVG